MWALDLVNPFSKVNGTISMVASQTNLSPIGCNLHPPVVPLFHGHVPDDVTAMAAAEDKEAGHQEVPDVEGRPLAHPEAVQELVGHCVQVIL